MTTTMSAAATPRRGAVRAVGALLVVELLVFGFSTVPGLRAHSGFAPWLDGSLQGAAYVTIAVLAALRPALMPTARLIWALVAVGLGMRALGFVLYLGFVRTIQPPPYPSVADFCWLVMPFVLLACAAVALALLQETLQDLTQAGTPHAVLVTNLLYPITDLLLLIVILGLLTAAEWRPPPVLVVVSLGVAGFAVVDSVFLYESTAGSYRPGTPLASLSLLATALIAAAAWVPPQLERPPG